MSRHPSIPAYHDGVIVVSRWMRPLDGDRGTSHKSFFDVTRCPIVRSLPPPAATLDETVRQRHLDHKLMQSALDGNLRDVERWLREGADIGARRGPRATPGHAATAAGHLPVIKHLLERGLKVNTENGKGEIMAHEAARQGHLECLQHLHVSGSDWQRRSTQGLRPLDLAVKKGRTTAASLITQYMTDDQYTDVQVTLELDRQRQSKRMLQILRGRDFLPGEGAPSQPRRSDPVLSAAGTQQLHIRVWAEWYVDVRLREAVGRVVAAADTTKMTSSTADRGRHRQIYI